MRYSVRCLAVLAIAILIPGLAAAQTEFGKLTGTVTDQSGAVLPGVSVTVTSVERATTRSTVTNSAGGYVFASLVPGNYDLTVELAGFSTKQTRTHVSVGATVDVNFQMAVGAQTEVVTVLGESAAQINTSTQDISTTINQTQIRELPTITRNVYDLVPCRQRVGRARRRWRGVERAAPATTSTASAPRAPTSCSTDRRTTTSSIPRSVSRSRSTPSRSSAWSPATSRRSTAARPAAS